MKEGVGGHPHLSEAHRSFSGCHLRGVETQNPVSLRPAPSGRPWGKAFCKRSPLLCACPQPGRESPLGSDAIFTFGVPEQAGHWGIAAGGGLICSPNLLSTRPRSWCSPSFRAFREPWSESQTPKAISSLTGKGRASDGGPLLVSSRRCLTPSAAGASTPASPERPSALLWPPSCPPLDSDLLRPSKTMGVA